MVKKITSGIKVILGESEYCNIDGHYLNYSSGFHHIHLNTIRITQE